jgi:transketolase
MSLGQVESKYRAFGWHVQRINGHDFHEIEKALGQAKKIKDRPQIIIADTSKGRGVSFMEHPAALEAGKGLYPWHSGAPDDTSYERGLDEILQRIHHSLEELHLEPLTLKRIVPEDTAIPVAMLAGEPLSQAAQEKLSMKVTDEYVGQAFGHALVEIAAYRKDIIVLDADLASDCRVREFENAYPERFIENGIAEQDMVSMAGGLARSGLLPVVNSFASFLASRANEQIYNNASEGTKIIYALHYAGLIPAGPGKSHQSLRDVSLFSALPNCEVVQPCNAAETKMAVEYGVKTAKVNVAVRLIIGPSPRRIELPEGYRLEPGRGVALNEGTDAMLFAYGPVMLHEALFASEFLAERGFGLKVINMPWLNRVDNQWLEQTVSPYESLFVLEDHHLSGGLTDTLLRGFARGSHHLLSGRRIITFAVENWPACGTPQEVLRFHDLDGASLATRILKQIDSPAETGRGCSG